MQIDWTRLTLWAAILAVVFWLFPSLMGCTATLQGGDITAMQKEMVREYARAAGIAGATTLPGGVIDESLAGSQFTIAPRLGNVTEFTTYYDSGAVKMHFKTDPTPIWGGMFGAANAYEGGKRGFDLDSVQAGFQMAQWLAAQAQPYGQAAMAEWQTTRDYRRANPRVRDESALDKILSRLNALENAATEPE